MDVRTEFTRLRVGADQSMIINNAAGAEIIVCRGAVWITQYGDSRDIVLRAGQSFTLDLPSGVLMSGSRGESEVILRAAPARAAAGTRRGRLARLLAWFDPRWGGRVWQGLAGRRRIVRIA